jgi:hypothetical protein
MELLKKIKTRAKYSKIGDWKRTFRREMQRAHIPRPNFEPAPGLEKGKQFLFVVDSFFDQDFPNAAAKIGNGFVRGWAKGVGPAKFVDVHNLMKEIRNFDRPAVCMSIYHLLSLNYRECRELRNYDVCISVTVHPRKIAEFEEKWLGANSGDDTNIWLENYGKVMAVQPKFVWNSASGEGMYWYQGWIDDGLYWQSVELAADDSICFPEKNEKEFGHVKLAYIGSYWPEKAQSLDKYLKPFEDDLWVFGYDKWPYKNYGGRITEAQERQVYSTAKIIPLVTSPGGWMITELTERYFKAPACRAFCIADENPAVRAVYTKEEMLQAESVEHFKQLVADVLAGKIDTEAWAEKSYRATLNKHLYLHRAQQMLRAFERKA